MRGRGRGGRGRCGRTHSISSLVGIPASCQTVSGAREAALQHSLISPDKRIRPMHCSSGLHLVQLGHICLQISLWHLAKLFVLVCQSRDSVLGWGWLIHIYAFVLEPHLAGTIHICSAALHYQCPPTQHSQLSRSLLSLEGRPALSHLQDYCHFNNNIIRTI